MDECHRIKGVMVSDDFKPGYRTLIRIRCKQWGCPYCGPVNAIQWRAYLLDTFNKRLGHEKWCFFTITASPAAHRSGAKATLLQLQKAWKKLYDHLLRRYGKGFQYLRVFEQHKSGNFHMHFLLNCGVQYDAHGFTIKDKLDEFRHPECKWLSKVMKKMTGAWRVHVKRVWDDVAKTENVGLVVGYVVKYLGKQMVDIDMPKHQRRIQTSRKIGSPKTASKGAGTWTHLRDVPLHMVKASPLPVLDFSTGEILTETSFEGEAYYPPLRYYKGDDVSKLIDTFELTMRSMGGTIDTSYHLSE